MGKHITKAAGNVFAEARYHAGTFNDRLLSREGASEELGIDRSRLARIELGSREEREREREKVTKISKFLKVETNGQMKIKFEEVV